MRVVGLRKRLQARLPPLCRAYAPLYNDVRAALANVSSAKSIDVVVFCFPAWPRTCVTAWRMSSIGSARVRWRASSLRSLTHRRASAPTPALRSERVSSPTMAPASSSARRQ